MRNDSSYYIVDRKLEDNVFNGAGQWLAKTVYGYDGSLGGPPNLTAGNLTLVRKYHNLPLSTALPASALSSDTSYGYDSYGNQTTVTTYAGSGTLSNGAAFSSPGGGSAGSATTTTYDSLFPALPVQVDTPPNQWNVRLTQRATYDYRLGAILHLTDPNGQTTTVSCYDVFGRMRHLTRPGDGYDAPTAWFEYYDWEYAGYGRPVKYLVGQREIGFDHGAWQATIAYYDGLGREIQTKVESGNGTQHIVTDKLYDGLGQVTAASQPRYVNQSGDSFWQYAPLLAERDPGYQQVHRWTRTTYDGLGRPRTITGPDGSLRWRRRQSRASQRSSSNLPRGGEAYRPVRHLWPGPISGHVC